MKHKYSVIYMLYKHYKHYSEMCLKSYASTILVTNKYIQTAILLHVPHEAPVTQLLMISC